MVDTAGGGLAACSPALGNIGFVSPVLVFLSSSNFSRILFIASASKSCLSHFEKLLNASFFGLSDSEVMLTLIEGRNEEARRRLGEELRFVLLVRD